MVSQMTKDEKMAVGAALVTLQNRITEVELTLEQISEIILETSKIEMMLAKRILKLEGETYTALT